MSTNEIAIHRPAAAVAVVPDQAAQPGTDLILWARQAEAAAIYAERVCSTQMVPVAYKNKPAEAAAAILAGAELGFGPMASLRAFHPINGTPAPAAITLRAVVTGHGHDIETVEQSPTRAVVRGRRKGSDNWQASVWDIDRASKLPQFGTNKNYQHNPGAMLVARATAEVCRWIASDAIMGMPYAAEEIQDEPTMAAAPAVRRLTVAELDAAPDADPRDEPMTDTQRGHLFKLWEELGYSTAEADRPTRLQVTAKILGLESLGSWSDLTMGQAHEVITAFIERKNKQAAE